MFVNSCYIVSALYLFAVSVYERFLMKLLWVIFVFLLLLDPIRNVLIAMILHIL